jgi:CheY-like chemotaxis protein
LPWSASPLAIGSPTQSAAPPHDAASAPEGRRILVVDDNEDAADMLASGLRLMGYVTLTAHDGPSALHAASEFHPEVALLDIGLPVMDGYEVARRLKNATPDRRMHLIAVTGYGQDTDRARSLQAGFDAHVVKPVKLAEIEALIRELVDAG